MEHRRTVLLLGDITGRSRVAVRMLTALLESRGREVLALPTALISNTLNLGRHAQLDTTDYLLSSLSAWQALGIGYDALYIGYITGTAQARALCDVACQARARGIPVLVDPILGDGGKPYNAVTADQVAGMRLLAAEATVLTPNLTEACLLTETPYEQASMGGEAMQALPERLTRAGNGVLITSAHTAQGGLAVMGRDGQTGEAICIPFARIEGKHYGTGDLFSAALLDGLCDGLPLASAARGAVETVTRAMLEGQLLQD